MEYQSTHHTEPIKISDRSARLLAASVIRDGFYTTPQEIQSIALNLDNPSALSNWDPDAVTRIWNALDGHNREWLEQDFFAMT
jgi:hypothetical protein